MVITIGSKIKDGDGNLYILDDILGSGGFGNVFKARREDTGEVFAVKTLLSSFESQESVLAFEKEVQQSLLVSSDHVIKYIFTHNGNMYNEYPPYIIMEYADGGTLTTLIEQQKKTGEPFKNDFLIDAFIQLAEGMSEINKTLVHRDIKPDNILISNGVLKVSDFGLSKLSGENTRTLTFKGYGTMQYVAPEAWNNDKNAAQMDIYSMGIVFYEFATLHYPYKIENSADIMTYRNAHLLEAAINPSDFNSALPANLISILNRMIEKPTQKRFSEWDSIIAALKVHTPQTDELSSVVQSAIQNRNNADLALQIQLSEKKKLEQEKDDFCRLVYAQYDSAILEPLREFILRFNTQYAGKSSLRMTPDRGFSNASHFSHTIYTPSQNNISINTEVVLAENHSRQVQVDRVFRDAGLRTINYIPKCENRDVLAWSQVTDSYGRGFNLLLIKVDGGLYGDWFILRNTNNGLSRSRRIEPFGFELDELPKEIELIHVTHIYCSELKPLNVADVPNFIAECI